MPAEHARAALDALDRILAAAPVPDHHQFSLCTQALCRAREAMRARGETGQALAHANAVISVVMAGQFPLGAVPWDELRLARGWLGGLAAT